MKYPTTYIFWEKKIITVPMYLIFALSWIFLAFASPFYYLKLAAALPFQVYYEKGVEMQFSCPIFQLSMKLIWIDVFEMRAYPTISVKKVRNTLESLVIPIWSYSKVNHDFDWLIQSTMGGVGDSLLQLWCFQRGVGFNEE